MDWLKNNGITIAISMGLGLVSMFATYTATTAVFGFRLDSIESRQDRQGQAITTLQASVADVQTQYAALNAKLDAIDSNVNYIRNRIDAQR